MCVLCKFKYIDNFLCDLRRGYSTERLWLRTPSLILEEGGVKSQNSKLKTPTLLHGAETSEILYVSIHKFYSYLIPKIKKSKNFFVDISFRRRSTIYWSGQSVRCVLCQNDTEAICFLFKSSKLIGIKITFKEILNVTIFVAFSIFI